MPTVELPPGPPASLLRGHLPELARDWLGGFERYVRQYGDVVPLRLGPRRSLLVNDPALIEQLLVSRARSFRKSPALRNSRRLLGDGLLTSEGDTWRRQRLLVQPAFHRQRLAAYGRVMAEYADDLASGWRDGEHRDLYADMMRLTLRIVGKTLFDMDLEREAEEIDAAITVAVGRFRTRMNGLQLFIPDTIPVPGNLSFLRAARRLDRLVYGMIDQRRRSGGDRGDLLSMLLQARDPETGRGMGDRQVRDEAMTLLIAGHETTAIALSWTWYLLAQNPRVEATLLDELERVLGGRTPAVEDLPSLRYAERVVTESLRLYPPAWSIAREATEDCELGGYRVPRDTIVVVSPWVMQRDARYFERPEVFDPDRWADGLRERIPRFAYFPFGSGPRICIGNTFATMETTLVLATIAGRYHLALEPGAKVRPWPSVTLRPDPGMPVIVQRR